MPSLHALLREMTDKGASDLHITAGSPPQLRVDGSLQPVEGESLSPTETKELCYSILTDQQRLRFEEDKELDLSFGIRGLSRFRANIFVQKGAVAGAFRTIPYRIPSMQDLGLPPVTSELTRIPRGLILVTGPTGSGKSTTLAAMIDLINTERSAHILTIEDPIEYLHRHKRGLINQREVGADTRDFLSSLKYVLRQDPDVVLIGEMRDRETMEAALNVSETGHLVMATLHTNSAVQTINRIIDVFPPYQQPQIRSQLSHVLEGVLSQILIPRKTGTGRILAAEVMRPNVAIRNMIREDKVHMIYNAMQAGQEKTGMITMNQALLTLFTSGLISQDEAFNRCTDVEEFQAMIANATGESRGKGARTRTRTRTAPKA
jgi:twitching motility protein PilT